MTMHSKISQTQGATLADLLAWAEAAGEPRDAIYEVLKIPARLGMNDDDIGLLPVDLGYFEAHIAPSGYGVVSTAADLAGARRRANGRIRALVNRYLAAPRGNPAPSGRQEWDALIAFVEAREGFVGQGAAFTTGCARSLTGLRARCGVAPRNITSALAERVSRDASAQKRKSLHRALRLVNRLIREFAAAPELVGLLPEGEVAIPRTSDRARAIAWSTLPAAFRESAETAFRRSFGRPKDRVAEARARLAAGECPKLVQRELNESAAGRRRLPKNLQAAREGYLRAVTWAVRAVEDLGIDRLALVDIADVMTFPVLDHATQAQIARAQASVTLKDPAKSQTLAARLTALQTLARHGLQRDDLLTNVQLVKQLHSEFILSPKEMTEEADRVCRMLQRHPHVAASFVNAPALISRRACKMLDAARAAGDADAELAALKLYAAAVFFVVQLSRPLRTSNLIALRLRGTETAAGHITWIKPKQHAELRFPPGEIKNLAEVTVHVMDDDAEILWRWTQELRARYLELRALADSPYVLPGSSAPRYVKDGITLPPGCVAPSTFSEFWALGADLVGLGLSTHQCRHAVATLILALEPGNFAKVAAVLGDTEETVRRHYGRDSGAQAAIEVRKALQTRHPDLFKKLKRRL